jgi:hypothetical protein
MIDAELHTVLHTLIVHDFQDAFKKMAKCWEWCIHIECDHFKGDGGQEAQSYILDQMAALVPEITYGSGTGSFLPGYPYLHKLFPL